MGGGPSSVVAARFTRRAHSPDDARPRVRLLADRSDDRRGPQQARIRLGHFQPQTAPALDVEGSIITGGKRYFGEHGSRTVTVRIKPGSLVGFNFLDAGLDLAHVQLGRVVRAAQRISTAARA